MNIKTTCPSCGAHTVVLLTINELNIYKSKNDLPNDFLERSVCECCKDDEYVFRKVI